MRKMEFNKMESFIAGVDKDCSAAERLTKLAAAGATGALGGPLAFSVVFLLP